jgi:ring-1,2-phenylacetyl-CoA epoxidase subunit PaaC
MTATPNPEALKALLYKMADDQLIYGHRNSEWTGIGPTLEEDISFSSVAQDKVGHAYNMYRLLEQLGEGDPDHVAFQRKAHEYRCSHFVEHPAEGYEFSLIRHFLMDHAEYLRIDMLTGSTYEPLANLAKKLRGEVKYHLFHANTLIKQLGNGSEESNLRLRHALDTAFPLALGLFEPSEYEKTLKEQGIFQGESVLREKWLDQVQEPLNNGNLTMPDPDSVEPAFGGRQGQHTEHLQPLLNEMTEVLQIDPNAEW